MLKVWLAVAAGLAKLLPIIAPLFKNAPQLQAAEPLYAGDGISRPQKAGFIMREYLPTTNKCRLQIVLPRNGFLYLCVSLFELHQKWRLFFLQYIED